jgi:hypothetical protein
MTVEATFVFAVRIATASFFEERKKDIVDSLLKRPKEKPLQINARV